MISQSFDNNYRSLGNYIPPTKIPITGYPTAGKMQVLEYTNMDYNNPNYNLAANGNQQNYSSVTKAYMQTCDANGVCSKYKIVQNPCDSGANQNVRQNQYSRI